MNVLTESEHELLGHRRLKLYETLCAIGGVLLLMKLQAEGFNFTKKITPPWMFFIVFKLYK